MKYYQGKGEVGQAPYNPTIILKMLLLCYLWNISERMTEVTANDSLSISLFLGIGANERVHDHSTLTLFKNRLIEKTGLKAYEEGCARITDIAKKSRLLLPNVTKLVNEIVSLNILEKISSASDKRGVLVRTTADGEKYMQYIQFLRQRFEEELAGINETDRQVMIVTINKVFKAIKRSYEEIKDKEAYPYDR